MKLVYLAGAREDQREAVAWYRKESQALARRFMTDREETLERIARSPFQLPLTGRGCRKARLSVFPYSIIFFQLPSSVLIVAVAHDSRRPEYWHKRPIPTVAK